MAEVKLSGRALLEDVAAAAPPAGSVAFWWMGQGSVILKGAGKVLYVDPYLKPDPRRQTPPLLKPEEVTNADYVLGTHDHSDHIDPTALPGISQASPQARFIVSKVNVKRLEELGIPRDRVLGLNHGETHTDGSLAIRGFKSSHEFLDEDPVLGFPYMGFVIDFAGVRVYHPGDTVPWEGMISQLRELSPQVAFLPINGRDGRRYRNGTIGNCTFQESVDIAGQAGVKLAVPVHWDMFAGNPGDPDAFVDYLEAKYPEVRSWVGAAGERVEWSLG